MYRVPVPVQNDYVEFSIVLQQDPPKHFKVRPGVTFLKVSDVHRNQFIAENNGIRFAYFRSINGHLVQIQDPNQSVGEMGLENGERIIANIQV
jgi:hypothetical protein